MNDYLIIKLSEAHRDDLLAEARASRLAREALAGRGAWSKRLAAHASRLTAGLRHGRGRGEPSHQGHGLLPRTQAGHR